MRSALVLVLVVVSCFIVSAVFANGEPGTVPSTSSSSSSSSSSSGSGGGGAVAVPTHAITPEQLAAGFTYELVVGAQFRVTFENQSHYVKLNSLTASTAAMTITSTPQTATLAVGDTRRFELTDDDYYDLSVSLNNIVVVNETATKAEFTLLSISEEVTEETKAVEGEKDKDAEKIRKKEAGEGFEFSNNIIYVIVGIVIVLIVVGMILKRRR